MNVHSSFNHSLPKLETTKMPYIYRRDEQTMVYPLKRILHKNKNEGTTGNCNKMNEFQIHYFMWKNASFKKASYSIISFVWYLKKANCRANCSGCQGQEVKGRFLFKGLEVLEWLKCSVVVVTWLYVFIKTYRSVSSKSCFIM